MAVSARMVGARFLWLVMAFLAAVVVLLGLACVGEGDTGPTVVVTLVTPTPTAVATATPTATPSPTATPTAEPDVCGVNPDPAPPSVLQVQEPQPGERVKNPFHVRGWGSEIGFENSGVVVALVDARGDPLPPVEVPPQTRAARVAPPGLKVTEFTRPFGTDMLVSGLRTSTPFCVWVFLETTPEGIAKQVVQVPVTVTP
jgi:hypothetical protein